MNNKLSGAIFMIFGMGLLGDSIENLYNNSISMDFESAQLIFLLLLAISSCIYGYKQIKNGNTPQAEEK